LINSFKDSKIPKWLNVALGYGAEGMITGNKRSTSNTAYNPKDSGNCI
jgi:hypothetical protein